EDEGDDAPVPPAPQVESQAKTSPPASAGTPVLPVVSRAVLDASSGTDEEKLQVVVEAMQKKDLAIEIRVWAAKQLSVFNPEEAVPPLREALKDDRPELVVAAIGSLKQLGDATTIPAIQMLRTHSDPSVQKAAREALGDNS
ncbi:HEAT repeat domain-containing protein, partial [Myxococcota bacterium]|nr:HEAT repeat domain-containing protein [Myxococcota bacterium]